MARFVIHVGPHKTGTTYIQRCLDRNAGNLRRQHIIVPTEWRDSPGNPSYTGLVRPIWQDRSADLIDTFMESRKLPDELVVISSEAILECSINELQALRELLADSDYTVVCYIRRWSELVISIWSEMIGQGWATPFPEFLLDVIENPESHHQINVDTYLSRLTHVIGKANIKLTSYNTVMDQGGRHF